MGKSLITKIIIGVVAAILLIVIISSIVKLAHKDKVDNVAEPVQDYINQTKGKLVKVDNITDLYLAKRCLLKFFENYFAITAIDKYTSEEAISISANTAIQAADAENRNSQYFKDVAFSMLAKDYVTKKNVSKDNMLEQGKGYENATVEIYNLYMLTEFEDVYVYFANGIIRNSDTNEGFEFNYIIAADEDKLTFEIYPDGYLDDVKDFSQLTEGSEIAFNIPTSVEDKEYNTHSVISVKYDQVARDTLSSIRTLMLYDTQKAYELLSTAMKDKYPTYESFKSYVDSKNKEIFSLTYGSYQLKSGENGMKFVVYNGDSSIKVTIDFDGFSSFKYSFEEMESYN